MLAAGLARKSVYPAFSAAIEGNGKDLLALRAGRQPSG